MARLMADLGVGEAQRGEAGGGVRLITEVVAGLLPGGAVIAQAAGLDHEAEFGAEAKLAGAKRGSAVNDQVLRAPRAGGQRHGDLDRSGSFVADHRLRAAAGSHSS